MVFKAASVQVKPGGSRGAARVKDASVEQPRAVQAIAGGVEASVDKWPFGVALAYRNQQGTLTQYCGGSLVSPDIVLTAAHCRVATGHYAILGRHDLASNKGRALRIVEVLSHVGFDERSFQNDIALLRLSAPVKEFPPVRLADESWELEEGQAVTALGWRATGEQGAASLVLNEVTVPVASSSTCMGQYARRYPITPGMVCTNTADLRDGCAGDSGGPLLVTTREGDVVQVGVASFGNGCARPGLFGVYTRVSAFRKWMSSVLVP
ncbi:serine protease [Myxococcus stipitatus]|uniref:serine protease n=1 Tax=Myxococcus stipitatus TaxID=83455 RepID=UPI001F27F66D|nr:serine protease [Myxococcus stipitatus]MCE9666320.1 serine protease [Myxococcus stipitatus]